MSIFSQRKPERSSFYLRKCRDHLLRGLASYKLAVRGLNSYDRPTLERELNLEAAAGHTPAKMKEVLVRAHFLLLKVNFELFLHLLALGAWRVTLREGRAGGSLSTSAKNRLRETKLDAESVLDHTDSVEAMCAAIVPAHGLETLCGRLADVKCDVRLLWNRVDPRIWAQLCTAFAVRHLIEHRNGWIDARFQGLVKSTWGASSWGKRSSAELHDRERIEVTEGDLFATQEAMLAALLALESMVEELDRRDVTNSP